MPLLTEIGVGSDLPKDQDKIFRFQTRHIAALVERNLPRLKTPNFWKVLIICSSRHHEQDFRTISGVMDVYVELDPQQFFELDLLSKKRFALEVVTEGLARVAAHTGLGACAFKEAIQRSAALKNEWWFPKSPVTSPSRQWSAQLQCIHELDWFTANLVVMNKQKRVVACDLVFKELPNEFIFVPRLTEPVWLSDVRIEVGDRCWKLDSKKQDFYVLEEG